ncbi:MAG: carotenoid 1,2-hydratase, partial [Anaerolineaceae bacterium]|nr:carotenoid 1,2-hydratase [Anaerolineaceae bacterium]
VISLPQNQGGTDYERVTGPRPLVLPRDLGPHPDFLTEWWYYTGNLAAEDGRRFGYQLTFFRRALQPPADRIRRSSNFAVEQVYMAHLAVTDVTEGKFHAFERFERGSAGLAGASGDPLYQVWLRDWSVEQVSENEYRLQATQDGLSLDLRLVDQKGLVLQGDRGYSQKGSDPGNASIYYSQTRLETSGTLNLDGGTYSLKGLSWLDREISTSALSKGQVGWDWFALQLDDGSELMVYVLRRSDGTPDVFSKGTLIQPDGKTISLAREDFQIQTKATWLSPHSSANYPSEWTVKIPSKDLFLQVKPLLADQELNLSFTYWEGAVEVLGTHAGVPVSGSGYVELAGYARSLEGGL